MKKNIDLILLFFAGLGVSFAAAIFQTTPGYMDASYSYAGGLQLVNGHGFSEPFIWNYLDNPSSLVHPAHTYWMPLPSLLAAAGMIITGHKTYFAARTFFIILAGCIPVLTALLANCWSRNRFMRIIAGCFAIFPGFYLIFTTATETFTLYMVLGAIFFLLARSLSEPQTIKVVLFFTRCVGIGIVAGLMHLTRADGILWLFGGLGFTLWLSWKNLRDHRHYSRSVLIGVPLAVIIGYLVCMSPWYLRNIQLYGWLFSPGGSRALWLTEYDQTYIYPASLLNLQAWLQSGWGDHFRIWGNAILQNLETFIGVQGCVVYFPFILVGMYQLRKQPVIVLGGCMWLLIFSAMTFAFPFAGPRGGFFHSGGGVQALFWSMVPLGLERVLSLGVKWRGWKMNSALPFFSVGFVFICLCITGVLFYARVIGEDPVNPKWQAQEGHYLSIESTLIEHDVDLDVPVMVNDPPGYFVANGRKSVAVPYGDVNTLIEVAKKYQIGYLILEDAHPVILDDLYDTPGDQDKMQYLGMIDDTQIYRFCEQTSCEERDSW